MRITLAQWVERGLPIDKGNGTTEDAAAECLECSTLTEKIGVVVRLCPYHEGFVDGFDAARGGE